MQQTFEAEIIQISDLWLVIFAPFDVKAAFGEKSRIDVCGTIDGVPYQRTLLPDGQGRHFIVTNTAIRKKLKKKAGDKVLVTMQPDETYAVVVLPDYFEEELENFPVAKAYYEKSAPSFKRWVVQFLTEPKSPDVKANRVIKMIEILEERAAR